jgi:hypothetical protein
MTHTPRMACATLHGMACATWHVHGMALHGMCHLARQLKCQLASRQLASDATESLQACWGVYSVCMLVKQKKSPKWCCIWNAGQSHPPQPQPRSRHPPTDMQQHNALISWHAT